MRAQIFLACLFFVMIISPCFALDVATLGFEDNLDENLEIYTADGNAVSVTEFITKEGMIEEVPIWVSTPVDLKNLDINLDYDNSVIIPDYVLEGNFNVTYSTQNGLRIILNPNESFTGKFLLAKVGFVAVGNEGKSTPILINVNQLKDESYGDIEYVAFSGIFGIESEEEEEIDRSGQEKLDGVLLGLINSTNRSEFAANNGLVIEGDEVNVIIDSGRETQEGFIDIDDLEKMAKSQNILSIIPYRESYLIYILIAAIPIIVAALFFMRKR